MNFSSDEFFERLLNREEAAINLLLESYNEQLFKVALKKNLSDDQAEEAVQSTWITFFEKIENFQRKSHIRTYLFGILINKIREIWRSNAKYTEDRQDYLENLYDDTGHYINKPKSPDNWLQSKQLAIIMNEEINKLPDNQKMAFLLKEVDGEKTEDICKILDISSTNLGVLIYRAKNTLRVKIEKRLNG